MKLQKEREKTKENFYVQVPRLKVWASAHDLFKVVVAEVYFFLQRLVLNKSVFKVMKIFKDSSYPIPHKNCGHIRPASICLTGLFSSKKKKTKHFWTLFDRSITRPFSNNKTNTNKKPKPGLTNCTNLHLIKTC